MRRAEKYRVTARTQGIHCSVVNRAGKLHSGRSSRGHFRSSVRQIHALSPMHSASRLVHSR